MKQILILFIVAIVFCCQTNQPENNEAVVDITTKAEKEAEAFYKDFLSIYVDRDGDIWIAPQREKGSMRMYYPYETADSLLLIEKRSFIEMRNSYCFTKEAGLSPAGVLAKINALLGLPDSVCAINYPVLYVDEEGKLFLEDENLDSKPFDVENKQLIAKWMNKIDQVQFRIEACATDSSPISAVFLRIQIEQLLLKGTV